MKSCENLEIKFVCGEKISYELPRSVKEEENREMMTSDEVTSHNNNNERGVGSGEHSMSFSSQNIEKYVTI
jgi:hypothetical protein